MSDPELAAPAAPAAVAREPLVVVRDLTKHYVRGDQVIPVLVGIDLDIQAGDYVALMGPSGSGKSTLLNLIGGLVRPTSGMLEVDFFFFTTGLVSEVHNSRHTATSRRTRFGVCIAALLALKVRHLDAPSWPRTAVDNSVCGQHEAIASTVACAPSLNTGCSSSCRR